MRHALLFPALLATALLLQAAEPVGVHHQKIGKLEVISLQDGEITGNISYLKGIGPAEAKRMLGGQDKIGLTVNAFLVRTPEQLVLVDTGTGGDGKGPTGHLLERMQAAGIDPAQVDLVLITHFHFDHVGGLVKADGTRAFPKAIVRVSQAEHDQWLSANSERQATIQKNLSPYQSANAYHPFAPGEAPGKGIRAVPTPGHTNGHSVFVFASEGKELWCIGDLIHVGAIQFERPKVAMSFDTDSDKAIATRTDIFQKAAASGAVLAGAHLAFPGLVRLKTKGEGFVPTYVK
jgi:glyoxylase-like metal-dependent hydrolase (beta-lactamase superfamily II)